VESDERRPQDDEAETETVLAPGGGITIALNPGRVAAMEPFAPDSDIPVVTPAVRQLKMLRSMAREVRSIRTHMTGLGIADTYLPPATAWDQQIADTDFASLTMALESHRSALNRVPLKPPMLYFYISSSYGKRKHPVTGQIRQHHGIDLAGTWQEEVHASAPGTVIHAGKMGSFGNVVRIRHAYDITTTYAHLSRILVNKGADVTHGTVIGKMGRTGRVDGAHLHYEIRIGRKSLNPQTFFNIGNRIGIGGALTQISSVD
jgi:murein DD-endopeptidase MepM/ murein hydrolase activator NlpD